MASVRTSNCPGPGTGTVASAIPAGRAAGKKILRILHSPFTTTSGEEIFSPRNIAALAAGSRLVSFSSGGGSVSAFDLFAGSKTITGLSVGRFSTIHRELYDQHSEELWP